MQDMTVSVLFTVSLYGFKQEGGKVFAGLTCSLFRVDGMYELLSSSCGYRVMDAVLLLLASSMPLL